VDTRRPRPLALVTGASRGIGYELAKQFAENGHDLVITAKDPVGLDQAARTLPGGDAAGDGDRITVVAADLTAPQDVERLYAAVKALGRPVDVLAANAGVGVGGDFTETDLEAELKLIDLNVRSQVHLIKLVVRDMVRRGSGKVLITSSAASLMPGPFEAVYAASKAFLRSFGEAIRNELSDKGVGVTVLMPGPTETGFFRRAGMDDTPVGHARKDNPANVAKAAFKALMANQHHVVTGLRTKVQAAATNILPDPALAAIHRRLSEPDQH
jgi:uncharacterized protein